MAKCIDDLKKRADVWGPIPETDITSGSTSNWSSEPLCLQGEVTVEIPKADFDHLIAIVERAEWGSILCDDIPDPQCPICGGSKESGHGLVYETKRPCPYSDEYKPNK